MRQTNIKPDNYSKSCLHQIFELKTWKVTHTPEACTIKYFEFVIYRKMDILYIKLKPFLLSVTFLRLDKHISLLQNLGQHLQHLFFRNLRIG
jgi:hypothetical protein